MLLDLYICDLTQFEGFAYWPVKDMGDDCIEAIKDGKADGAIYFTVYGIRGEVEDAVADFSTLAEAATYCLMLNAAVQGRTVEFEKPQKEEQDAPESDGIIKGEDGEPINIHNLKEAGDA